MPDCTCSVLQMKAGLLYVLLDIQRAYLQHDVLQ